MTPNPAMENPHVAPPPISSYPNPYTAPSTPLPILGRDMNVSPGLAFLLGFIPGVGAIYNGQYSKGIVHVIIIGLMISLMANGTVDAYLPLMGLLLAAFWFYMCFEAFHTAQLRQQGLKVDEFSSLIPMRGGSASRFPAAPLMLIALGVVLLLNTMDIVDLQRLMKYWPVGLIALGIYMLFLRVGNPMSRNESAKGEPR